MVAFHNVSFPRRVALGASVTTERRTEVVTLGSGFEERNTKWAHSRRQYDAGQGVRTIDDLHDILSFFEERRGMLHGFRWHDRVDYKSCAPSKIVSAFDQVLGHGNGTQTRFSLKKTYGKDFEPYTRRISKPVSDSVKVAVDGVELDDAEGFDVDQLSGDVVFDAPVAEGLVVQAGFEFDVPVRFASDRLEINLSTFSAGDIPTIPLLEIRQ